MANSILDNLTFDPARGALLYEGVRYLLIRPETLIAFQRAAEEKLGRQADEFLYAGGFTGGTLSAKKYREVFGLSDEESVRFMANMGTEIGWGRISICELNVPQRRLDIEVEASPFAAAYGPADRGICHLVRGVFAGLAQGIFGREVTAREEKCLAMGNSHCRMVIQSIDKSAASS